MAVKVVCSADVCFAVKVVCPADVCLAVKVVCSADVCLAVKEVVIFGRASEPIVSSEGLFLGKSQKDDDIREGPGWNGSRKPAI